jgi:hypothetical protein
VRNQKPPPKKRAKDTVYRGRQAGGHAEIFSKGEDTKKIAHAGRMTWRDGKAEGHLG